MNDLIEYLIIINIVCFFTYGLDKFLACKHLTRVPEVVLFLFAIIGSPLGALLGMKFFNHKTKKMKFWIINVLLLIIYTYIIYRTYGV